MNRDAELTFGYGRFKCLGQPVALLELNKIFVELLRNFDIALINPAKPWSNESRGIFLQKNFWVRVTERESLSADGKNSSRQVTSASDLQQVMKSL